MESELQQESHQQSGLRQKIKGWPRWLKWALCIVILLGTAAAAAVPRLSGNSLPVNVINIQKQDIERNVVASGRLEAVDKQEFFAPVDSTLMELAVEVGDRVKKGQFLGRLDTLELGRRYEQAKAELAGKQAALAAGKAVRDDLTLKQTKAQYDQAKNHLERIAFLHEQGAVTTEELESARVDLARADTEYQKAQIKVKEGAAAKEVSSLEAQVALARQEVAQTKERLDLATFVAEKSGVVLFVGEEKGNRVQEGTRLLVVGSDDELEVTTGVNEIDAGNLEVGQPVQITCAALPGEKYEGEVKRVAAAAISQQTSAGDMVSVPVTIQLQGNAENLKLGYTVDLAVTTMTRKNVLTVPFEALVNKDGHKIVYVVQNGVARERTVDTEQGNELNDIITSGLKDGEQVIINPPPLIKDGQEVTIADAGEIR